MGITISQRERGTGSLKTREEEAAGISAKQQGFSKEEPQNQAQRWRGSLLVSLRMAISLGESRQEERPSYPPVFLMYRKYTRAVIRATPATTPITMPAMAPPERPGLGDVEISVMKREE